MTRVWTPDRYGDNRKPDIKRCRASVSYTLGSGWARSSQCTRKGAVEEDGMLWRKQHAPSAAKKRRDDSSARWKAESEHQSRVWEAKSLHRQIAQKAIDYFQQRATFEELEQAVSAYDKFVGEHEFTRLV